MNRIDEDDLDAFLWEVEHVSKQVNDIITGKVDLNKIKEKEDAILKKREKEAEMKLFKEEQAKIEKEEKLKNGIKGKGEKENYLLLCKKCFVEYQIEMDKCYHCSGELITKKTRHDELKAKIEELKDKKTRKKFRKQKYENWIKTEQVMKSTKINFRNYEKWDMYESSTDEEESAEPILPRHDPNFLAMEKDMIETQKKREISRNKAIKLKDEGNLMLQEFKYKKAIKLYTEAIDEFKGMMSLYTNRAMAYIKTEDYDNALNDCEKVIEYLEIFDDQLKLNKDIYIKALSRKAICCQKMKKFSDAKFSIDKALELTKSDEMEMLRTNILLEEEVHLKALDVIEGDLTQFKSINEFIELLRESNNHLEFEKTFIKLKENFEKFKIILKIQENNKLYLIQKGGLEIIFLFIRNFPNLLELIEIFNSDKKYIIMMNNIKGYHKLIKLLFEEKNNDNNKNKIMDINSIKKIVSILEDASQHVEVRTSVSEIKHLDKLFLISLSKFDISKENIINDSNSVIILMRLFTFICNMTYNSSTLRRGLASNYNSFLENVGKFAKKFDFNNHLHTSLLESIISLLINLSCDDNIRTKLCKEIELIKFLINSNLEKTILNIVKYDELYEKSMSLLYNITFNSDLSENYLSEGLANIVIKYIVDLLDENFKKTGPISALRTLMLTVKLVKSNYSLFLRDTDTNFFIKISKITNLKMLETNPKIIDNTIKILSHFLNKSKNSYISNIINSTILMNSDFNLINNLQLIFLKDYDNLEKETERIVNNMSLMITILEIKPLIACNMKLIVKNIISIAKDKTDVLRKNAAILLAKIVKSSDEMEAYVRELHGIEVLLNVAKFIKLNNK